MIIQRLLAEAGVGGVGDDLVSVDARGLEAAADWGSLKSPENYVGYQRTQNFASPGGAVLDKPRMYQLPARLRLNDWALSGDWTVRKESAALNKANGTISSWAQQCQEPPCGFACGSRDSRQVRLMELTLTSEATARSPNSVCTN
jgi:hypothetical protein